MQLALDRPRRGPLWWVAYHIVVVVVQILPHIFKGHRISAWARLAAAATEVVLARFCRRKLGVRSEQRRRRRSSTSRAASSTPSSPRQSPKSAPSKSTDFSRLGLELERRRRAHLAGLRVHRSPRAPEIDARCRRGFDLAAKNSWASFGMMVELVGRARLHAGLMTYTEYTVTTYARRGRLVIFSSRLTPRSAPSNASCPWRSACSTGHSRGGILFLFHSSHVPAASPWR